MLLIVLFLLSSICLADNSFDIRGQVKYVTNEPVRNADITLLNSRQLFIANTSSDEDGYFSFEDVARGSYAIVVNAAEVREQRFALQLDSDISIELILELSPMEERVTVTADSGRVYDRDSIPQQTNIIGQQEINLRLKAVLAEIGEEEPGLKLQRTSPTIGSIFIRALTGKNVNVYVDGVRFTNTAQRGGINTFFNTLTPTALQAVEIIRGPSSAQYGSDSLGGTVSLITKLPRYNNPLNGQFSTSFNYADLSYGSNLLLTYGQKRFSLLTNLDARRVNTLRPADGLDSHAAVTRFLGLPSNILGTRLPDTAFTQYGSTVRLGVLPVPNTQVTLFYQRGQQDGGKRYDLLLGGDGNLIAELRNLQTDLFYARLDRQGLQFFDGGSIAFSYNAQREERVNQGGQGNPLATITAQYEKTKAYGFNFQLDRFLRKRYNLLLGGDFYRERVASPAYSFIPTSGIFRPARPRVPNGARYITAGLFLQNMLQISNSLRIGSALRYSVGSYKTRTAESPLTRDDSLRTDAFAGRIGFVYSPSSTFDIAFNYSRGFRVPSITDLGTLGLTGDGFEVASPDLIGLGATVGSTADSKAVSTGKPVKQQEPEFSNNYDISIRYHDRKIETDLTVFLIDIVNTITKQALILPQGAVGRFLADQPIIAQLPNGVVFVPISTSPVLVRANLGDSRFSGIEYSFKYRVTYELTVAGNYTYIRAYDRRTGAPPTIEGGVPPAQGFLRVRYEPQRKPFWMEVYSTLADRQERLSSLDLADRRTGATRSRSSIAAFFQNGARVRGLISPGPDRRFGTADDQLIPTGETLAQVQNRILGSLQSAPLFPYLPGYGLVGMRGGVKIGENDSLIFDFSNIADKSYRSVSWGIDGAGRSIAIRYTRTF
ncbi:MAG: TonB-dependent receptor [Acidobacteriota bacterium]|nr:TonB-dependent receptor [Blastocatellia bacterium]MDW8412959.1 TonB-dependent receptor [Acidobacteriota bacterium]